MLVTEGRTKAQIELALGLARSSIKHHAASIYLKLQGRTAAAVHFTEWRDGLPAEWPSLCQQQKPVAIYYTYPYC